MSPEEAAEMNHWMRWLPASVVALSLFLAGAGAGRADATATHEIESLKEMVRQLADRVRQLEDEKANPNVDAGQHAAGSAAGGDSAHPALGS